MFTFNQKRWCVVNEVSARQVWSVVCISCAMGITILAHVLRSCAEVVFNSFPFFYHICSVIMASLALRVILARIGLEDPDAGSSR